MESASLFIAIVLSMAVLSSMRFNPRRLEAFGYSLGVLFFQVLIAGYEDVFFICPQFPIYVSPKDSNLDPDKTMPDPKARGVYVDTALVLARCTSVRTGTRDSIAATFANRHRDRDFSEIDVTSMEVPILEERKRAPTRHPKDLEDCFSSLDTALDRAQRQVLSQARILFSSRRFAEQELVILLATAGQYYRIAVLRRDHGVFGKVPNEFDVENVLDAQEKDCDDLGEDSDDYLSELILSSTIVQEREQIPEMFRQQEEKRQSATSDALNNAQNEALPDHERQRPSSDQTAPPVFKDGLIESFYKLSRLSTDEYHRYPQFFEPKSRANETIDSFARIRDPHDRTKVVFTGVIRVGSPVSDRFVQMIRQYLSGLADNERVRRQN
jgi:hypothetical protein